MGLVRFWLKSVAVCIPAYVSYKIQVVEDHFVRGRPLWGGEGK